MFPFEFVYIHRNERFVCIPTNWTDLNIAIISLNRTCSIKKSLPANNFLLFLLLLEVSTLSLFTCMDKTWLKMGQGSFNDDRTGRLFSNDCQFSTCPWHFSDRYLHFNSQDWRLLTVHRVIFSRSELDTASRYSGAICFIQFAKGRYFSFFPLVLLVPFCSSYSSNGVSSLEWDGGERMYDMTGGCVQSAKSGTRRKKCSLLFSSNLNKLLLVLSPISVVSHKQYLLRQGGLHSC